MWGIMGVLYYRLAEKGVIELHPFLRWRGEGGACFFVPNAHAALLILPALSQCTAEQAVGVSLVLMLRHKQLIYPLWIEICFLPTAGILWRWTIYCFFFLSLSTVERLVQHFLFFFCLSGDGKYFPQVVCSVIHIYITSVYSPSSPSPPYNMEMYPV